MTNFFVYILYSTSIDKYYVGYTNVRWHSKKRKKTDLLLKNLWRTVRFFWTFWLVGLTDFAGFRGFARRTIPRRFSKERIGLITFHTTTYNERKRGNGDFRIEYKKTKFVFCWLCSLAGWKWLTNKLDEKKKQTHWQPEKKKNPFRAVVKVLKRKNFRLRFYISTDFQFI